MIWSAKSSSPPRFPDSRAGASLRAVLDAWVRRRGRSEPPLTLSYRRIFILPTAFGWLVGLLMFAMLLGSLNFNNSLGLLTTFLVAGIGVASMLLAYRNLDGIRIESVSAEPAHAGGALPLRVRLRETGGRDRPGLVTGSGRGDLPASGEMAIALEVPAPARGWHRVGRVRLSTRQPLGLFEAWSWFWPERAFLVWPGLHPDPPPLPRSAGDSDSSLPGDESDEFHGLRKWREGDPLHRIAWKASQRHGTLLARQFTRPRRSRLVLSLESAPGANLEERLSILASWVLTAHARGVDYGLDLGRERLPPDSGEAHRVRCLDALATCSTGP